MVLQLQKLLMPRISIILKRSPACELITLLERTDDREKRVAENPMLSISASLYEKKVYINSKRRNDFFFSMSLRYIAPRSVIEK